MKKTFVIYLSFVAIFLFGMVNFVSAQILVEGCGSSNGQTLTIAPTTNLCLSGAASAVTPTPDNIWTWTCPRVNGPTSYSCSAKMSYSGACGTAQGQTFDINPAQLSSSSSKFLCSVGSASTVTLSGREWMWTCSAVAGAAPANCWAIQPAPVQIPVQIAGWTWCAYEGADCAFDGTKEVQFGANGQYNTKTLTGGTSCTWSVFGDPVAGTVKQCLYRDVVLSPTPTPTPTHGGACNNLTFVGGSLTPNTVSALTPAVATGSDYTVRCDYGTANVDSINPVVGSGSCTFFAFDGTPAYFHCKAGTTTGTFSNYCTVVNGTSSNNCVRRDLINSLTVTAPGTVTYGCGSANGQTHTTAPTTNLCLSGTASALSPTTAGTWTWTCPGVNGPTSYSCSAKMASPTPNTIGGTCGSSHSKTFTTTPTAYLCATGTATTPTLTGSEWLWQCNGTNGGTSIGCWAIKAVTPTPTPGDTTPPSTPTSLTAKALSTTQVSLSWTASTDNRAVSGYKIYRNGVLLILTTATSYTNSALTPSTAYQYTVAAYDAANNTSAQSAPVSVTTLTPDTQAPTTPSNITVWKTTITTQVVIVWNLSTDNTKVVGYKIYRNGVLLTSTPNNYYNVPTVTATPYTYSVSAYDAARNESQQTTIVTPTQYSTDTQAPAAPSGFTATVLSVTQTQLTWNPSTDNSRVVGYKIYRNDVKIAATTGTLFKNINLAPGTSYTYKVSAYDIAGNESSQSTATASTPVDTQAPTVPANFKATPISTTQIRLTWTASTDNAKVTGYNIYRGDVRLGTATGVSYTNIGLTPTTSYTYSISAYDASGNTSQQTAPVTATTLTPDTQAPTTPTNLTATPYSQTRINLSWTAATDNVSVAGYKIYRNGAYVGATSALIYASAGLVANTTYNYTVAAYDAAGNISQQTTAVSGTTLP